MWKDDATAADILLAAQAVQDFVAGMTKELFLDDFKTQCAVLQQIIVLGEATKRLSAAFRAKHSQIPWEDIAGMRDRCVHGYDQVDVEIVWQVTQEHAPKLAQYLEGVVPKPPGTGQV
jgi:uncharacterized protein with HEPN domain